MVKLDCDIWLPILSYIIGGFVGSFGMIMMYTPQKHSKLFIWFGFAALNIGFILAAIPLQRIIPLHIFLAFCFTFFNIYFLLPDTEITRQKAAGLLIGRPRKPA